MIEHTRVRRRVEQPFFSGNFDMQIVCAVVLRFFGWGKFPLTRARARRARGSELRPRPRPWPRADEKSPLRFFPLQITYTWASCTHKGRYLACRVLYSLVAILGNWVARMREKCIDFIFCPAWPRESGQAEANSWT